MNDSQMYYSTDLRTWTNEEINPLTCCYTMLNTSNKTFITGKPNGVILYDGSNNKTITISKEAASTYIKLIWEYNSTVYYSDIHGNIYYINDVLEPVSCNVSIPDYNESAYYYIRSWGDSYYIMRDKYSTPQLIIIENGTTFKTFTIDNEYGATVYFGNDSDKILIYLSNGKMYYYTKGMTEIGKLPNNMGTDFTPNLIFSNGLIFGIDKDNNKTYAYNGKWAECGSKTFNLNRVEIAQTKPRSCGVWKIYYLNNKIYSPIKDDILYEIEIVKK